jgi:hypothetical protein
MICCKDFLQISDSESESSLEPTQKSTNVFAPFKGVLETQELVPATKRLIVCLSCKAT